MSLSVHSLARRDLGILLARDENVVRDRRTEERRVSERRGKGGRLCAPHEREAPWNASCDIIGYAIEASDGALGRVEAFCVEDESLMITEIVVAAARRQGKRRCILVPLSAVGRIDAQERKLYLNSTRDEIRQWSEARVVR
jgi:hypothetical protein